jgi:branched-chain amino acid transport system substrate-binding protein
MKHANSAEPAKILAELPKTDYQGVTTRINFDDKGDLKDGAISLYIAKGGKWEALDTIGGATTSTPAEPTPASAAAIAPASAPAATPVATPEKK